MPETVERTHKMKEPPEYIDVANPTVPYIVYESAMARSERHTRRLIVALVIAIVLIVASNMAWLWAWMQYDYTSDMTTTETYEYQQDGKGVNIIGDNNGINDVAESEDYEENSQGEDAEEEECQFEGNT